LLNAKAKTVADKLNPIMHKAAMIILGIVFFILIYVYFGEIIALEGGVLLAILTFFVLAFAAGYFSGGPEWQNRRALGIMTFVRNGSIAILIARDIFVDDPKVLVITTVLAVGSVIGAVLTVVLMGRSVPDSVTEST